MTPNTITLDRMAFNKMFFDEMRLDTVAFDKMIFNELMLTK